MIEEILIKDAFGNTHLPGETYFDYDRRMYYKIPHSKAFYKAGLRGLGADVVEPKEPKSTSDVGLLMTEDEIFYWKDYYEKKLGITILVKVVNPLENITKNWNFANAPQISGYTLYKSFIKKPSFYVDFQYYYFYLPVGSGLVLCERTKEQIASKDWSKERCAVTGETTNLAKMLLPIGIIGGLIFLAVMLTGRGKGATPATKA